MKQTQNCVKCKEDKGCNSASSWCKIYLNAPHAGAQSWAAVERAAVILARKDGIVSQEEKARDHPLILGSSSSMFEDMGLWWCEWGLVRLGFFSR